MYLKIIIYLSLIVINGFSKDFKIATYNVENFFDLKKDGTEYKEYIPNTNYWNKKSYNTELSNIVQVLEDLNADIIALQEIESKVAFEAIQKRSGYKYGTFIKNYNSAVGLGVLSNYHIIETNNIKVNRFDKYARDILKAIIKIENTKLIIYVNHWRSKRASESKRIPYAIALKNDIEKLNKYDDYIIVGDLNSNYNEYQTFKYDRKLNDTYGITAINQVLNTTLKNNFIKKQNILSYTDEIVHYNLWLEIEQKERFSSRFRKNFDTPDNIIVSKALFDNYGISYKDKSFNVFKPNYLYKNGYVQRWNIKRSYGYSDHLPIYAVFSTTTQNNIIYKTSKPIDDLKRYDISYLYTIEHLNQPITLKEAVIIYKAKDIAILKQKNKRAIMIYKQNDKLKLGEKYILSVDKIDSYNGLKEIKAISNITYINNKDNINSYYVDGNTINLFDLRYQNDIITNIEGIYKKGYLYFKDTKIKLYFKKGIQRAKDDQKLQIIKAQLGIYKGKVQLIINSKEDLKAIF